MSTGAHGGPEPGALAARFQAQLLTGRRASTVVEVVDRLLAVQAQDSRGFRLAVRVRSTGLSVDDVERALTVDRSVVVAWLNRGTLHLVRAEDHRWLHALTTPQLRTTNATRLAQEGVTPAAADRGVAVIERSLAADGPLTRADLRERIAAAGVRVEGQALVHLLFLSELRGLTVRGPIVGGEQAHVLVRDWLPPDQLGRDALGGDVCGLDVSGGDRRRATLPPDRDEALTRLAGRYLAGHGPATDRDLARWAGLPLRDVRRGFAGLGTRLVDAGAGLVDLASACGRADPPVPPPLLLGAFDPLLMGWVSREPVLGEATGVVTSNGIFRPIALVDGRAAATWSMPAGRVELTPFAPLPPRTVSALEADAADVARFLRRSSTKVTDAPAGPRP